MSEERQKNVLAGGVLLLNFRPDMRPQKCFAMQNCDTCLVRQRSKLSSRPNEEYHRPAVTVNRLIVSAAK
jgi:hypothetical protein